MNKSLIPTNIKQSSFQLKNFLGSDFTTHPSEVNPKRSPDSINMIMGQEGSVDKRTGIKIEKEFEGKIWAIRHVKTYVYANETPTYKVDITATIVHEGTRLWVYNPYLDTWTQAKYLYDATYHDVVLQERKTKFIDYPNTSSKILIHNNWILSKDDLMVLYCGGSTLGTERGQLWFFIYLNDSASVDAYIPTTSIGRSPDGKISTIYEGSNLILNTRINKFLSDSTSTVYKLDYKGSYGSFPFSISQMQSDGTFSSNLHNASGSTITWTYNSSLNTVTFSGVPHETYITGQDNIKIYYRTGSSQKVITSNINDYESSEFFGLNGQNNFVFFCNNKSNRNKEIWIKFISDEYGSISVYLDENNYSQLGVNLKLGYSKVGEYLILHGKSENSSPVAYLKSFELDADGDAYTKNVPTTSQVGTLSPYAFGNLRDDPIFLSEFGVGAFLIDKITGVQSIQDRGFYINKKLLEEENLENAIGFVYDNKYFLCINNHVYVADSRRKSVENKSYSESFQYDWYYWEGLDIQSYSISDNILYFGTSDGFLYRFKKNTEQFAFSDEYKKSSYPWQSGILISKDDIISYDGSYYVCLKTHGTGSLFVSKYFNQVVKNGDIFEVPVIAYWTTPIINMGNITALKTLKNIWVRIARYKKSGVEIYYKVRGEISLVKQKNADIFSYDDIDFERFTFNTDSDPEVAVTNRMIRKFMSIQFKFQNSRAEEFSLLEVVGTYMTNSQYKG